MGKIKLQELRSQDQNVTLTGVEITVKDLPSYNFSINPHSVDSSELEDQAIVSEIFTKYRQAWVSLAK